MIEKSVPCLTGCFDSKTHAGVPFAYHAPGCPNAPKPKEPSAEPVSDEEIVEMVEFFGRQARIERNAERHAADCKTYESERRAMKSSIATRDETITTLRAEVEKRQMTLDKVTKPLHVEIERLRAELAAIKAQAEDATEYVLAIENRELRATVERLEKERDGYRSRLAVMLPLFEEARDALPAISVTTARLRNVRLDLADRMDEVGNPERWAAR